MAANHPGKLFRSGLLKPRQDDGVVGCRNVGWEINAKAVLSTIWRIWNGNSSLGTVFIARPSCIIYIDIRPPAAICRCENGRVVGVRHPSPRVGGSITYISGIGATTGGLRATAGYGRSIDGLRSTRSERLRSGATGQQNDQSKEWYRRIYNCFHWVNIEFI